MPKQRPRQKLLPSHVIKNKRQAFVPQAIGFGDVEAITTTIVSAVSKAKRYYFGQL